MLKNPHLPFHRLGRSNLPSSGEKSVSLDNGSLVPFISKSSKAYTPAMVTSRTKIKEDDKEFLNIICSICYTGGVIDETVANQRLMNPFVVGLIAEIGVKQIFGKQKESSLAEWISESFSAFLDGKHIGKGDYGGFLKEVQ